MVNVSVSITGVTEVYLVLVSVIGLFVHEGVTVIVQVSLSTTGVSGGVVTSTVVISVIMVG